LPGNPGLQPVFGGGVAVLLGDLTVILRPLAPALGPKSLFFCREFTFGHAGLSVMRHTLPASLGRAEVACSLVDTRVYSQPSARRLVVSALHSPVAYVQPSVGVVEGPVPGQAGVKGVAMESKPKGAFDAQAFLDSAGIARRIAAYQRGDVIFAQGDPCDNVLYIQKGGVKLSVISVTGREAVVGMLGPGDFFGEGCLAGQTIRMGSATAITASRILLVDKTQMVRQLHKQHELSDRFIAHMLARNIRIEEDLIDQLFNSSEKRLARTLLLLAQYGKDESPQTDIPRISQETLAEMIGTTRARVNFFMNKFQRLGFIDYKDGLKVHNALLTIVLHD
jgi:CRP-like cAMP-binding protein